MAASSTPDDDPFTTPSPVVTLPSASPSLLRRQLESQLIETRKRLESAGQLGRDLVEQEKQISERLEELKTVGEEVDPDLRRRLEVLEKEYNDVGRGTARALLTSRVVGERDRSPLGVRTQGSNLSPSHTSNSPSKLTVPATSSSSSRRQRNQPSQHDDLDFATKLCQGLIVEARKLQALLSEAEDQIKVLNSEKAGLEQYVQDLEVRIKALDESEQRYKEENWNLEMMIQELRAEASEQKETEAKLTAHLAALTHEKNIVIKELDEIKDHNAQITQELNQKYKQHEGEVAMLRRHLLNTEADRENLQKKVEELKADLDEAQKIGLRLRLQEQRAASGEYVKDALAVPLPDDDTPEHSPPPSPLKNTPRHNNALETETLKSSLHHAHRMITSLKSNIHREKTEKAELKRLLQEAREEIEGTRSTFGTPTSGTAKRRKPDGTFRKTQKNYTMLGGRRKSRDEIRMVEHSMDDEWEEAGDSPEGPSRRGLGVFGLSVSSGPNTVPTTPTDESAFETANERNAESTDDFLTANEQGSTTNDAPTSGDELTETETTRPGRPLRAKSSLASGLSSRSARRSQTSRSRPRLDSVVSFTSTASTSDDDDTPRFHLQPGFDPDSMSLPPPHFAAEELDERTITSTNSRLKLRINRTRLRGRMPSDGSLFNSAHSSFNELMTPSPHTPIMSADSPSTFRPSIPAIRKSLFAELGQSPSMMMSPGGYDTEPDETVIGTPVRGKATYSRLELPRALMVDVGVMTEVPYPETPLLLLEEREEGERPHTATTVASDATTLLHEPLAMKMSATPPSTPPVKKAVMATMETQTEMLSSDVGVQSEEPVKPELRDTATMHTPSVVSISTQSDEEARASVEDKATMHAPELSEMGTQSEEEPKKEEMERGTQSEEVKKEEMERGTQSDEETKKVQVEKGTQIGIEIVDEPPKLPMLEVGTQYDADWESQWVLASSESHLGATTAAAGVGAVGAVGVIAAMTKITSPVLPDKEQVKEITQDGPEKKTEPAERREIHTQTDKDNDKEEVVTAPTQTPKLPPSTIVHGRIAQETVPEDTRMDVERSALVFLGTTVDIIPEEPVIPETPLEITSIREVESMPMVEETVQEKMEVSRIREVETPPVVEMRAPQVPLEVSRIWEVASEPVYSPDTPLDVSEIREIATEPEQANEGNSMIPVPLPIILNSGEETASIASDIETAPEKKGFFSSLFGASKPASVKERRSRSRTPSVVSITSSQSRASSVVRKPQIQELEDGEETIRRKDARRSRPPIPVAQVDQMMQTEISFDYVDQLEKEIEQTKKALVLATAVEVQAPSLNSRPSQESMGRTRSRNSADATVRQLGAGASRPPGSSSSMHGNLTSFETPAKNTMGPPPLPTSYRSTSTTYTRPRTPHTQQQDTTTTATIRSLRPETPSRGGATPRPPRFSSLRSSTHSSRRSSLSSFASEIDTRFNLDPPTLFAPRQPTSTDPRVIQAITQTMIGEYLWKYVRAPGRKDLSSTRHRRFFWVHPYTRTLYWSDRDPQTAGRTELRAKSVAIEAVKVVTDDNPMPPGLHRRSIVVVTPGRVIKFTAPTGARHEMWFSALSYLLLRTGERAGDDSIGAAATDLDEDAVSSTSNSPQHYMTRSSGSHTPTLHATTTTSGAGGGVYNPRSTMRAASASFTSQSQAGYTTPSRNNSSLSNRRPGEPGSGSASKGTVGMGMARLSSIWRSASAGGSYADTETEGEGDGWENSEHHHHHHGAGGSGLEGVENVRACCDGRHDVSNLSRRGGRRSVNSYRSGRKSAQSQVNVGGAGRDARDALS